mgnify:CR=1 FL=1
MKKKLVAVLMTITMIGEILAKKIYSRLFSSGSGA